MGVHDEFKLLAHTLQFRNGDNDKAPEAGQDCGAIDLKQKKEPTIEQHGE